MLGGDTAPKETQATSKDESAVLIHRKFIDFLDKFVSTQNPLTLSFSLNGNPPTDLVYHNQVKVLMMKNKRTLYVDFMQIKKFDNDLATAIESEYYRYEPFLRKAVYLFASQAIPEFLVREKSNNQEGQEFWIHMYNFPSVYKLRDLRTSAVGRLTSIVGTITRTSEVRPELLFGTFICLDCNNIIKDVEQQFKYTEPITCPNAACRNFTRWQLVTDSSKFIDWQKLRVQENANEIPSGSMPRSMDVVLRHEAVEKGKAGDKCIFTGMLIVVPDVSALKMPGGAVKSFREMPADGQGFSQSGVGGLKQSGVKELTYKLVFLASSVRPAESNIGVINIRDEAEEDVVGQFTEEERREVVRMKYDKDLYNNVVKSIAPAVWGHEDVKRGILLMLFGGVHKTTSEGINLRGDINVCVVGDPSVAKSQFLKYVAGLVPRSVYTSGKASSAAGLTASVVRDPDTNDFNFEAGALMLADNGICCIDEFDKMDPADQVAIHEAMEQQTISIAKAGIQATLNARTSILAAANPIGGRYDTQKSLKGNLNISAAIMSRFDLLFVVCDKNSEIEDTKLATHIVKVHQRKDKAIDPPYSTGTIQRYIKFAKTLKPQFSSEAQQALVEEYTKLRKSDSFGKQQSYRITVRQLESIIRLSEALARLHLETAINPAWVHEAARLLKKSIITIEADDIVLENFGIPDVALDTVIPTPDEEPMDEDPPKKSSKKKTKTSKVKSEKPKQTVAIPSEKYHTIVLAISRYMRKLTNEKDSQGLKQSQIVSWYIENHCGSVEGDEDVQLEYAVVRAVVSRMVAKDNTLIVVRDDGKKQDRRVLALNPNFVVED